MSLFKKLFNTKKESTSSVSVIDEISNLLKTSNSTDEFLSRFARSTVDCNISSIKLHGDIWAYMVNNRVNEMTAFTIRLPKEGKPVWLKMQSTRVLEGKKHTQKDVENFTTEVFNPMVNEY